MIACHIFRHLAIGIIFLPYLSIAQSNYVWSAGYPMDKAGNGVTAAIPRNEVNVHAYRHFYRRWPSAVGEVWSRTSDGFAVTFSERSMRHRVFFNMRGRFLYEIAYYPGELISPELAGIVKKKFPDYLINVVTEVTDGNKTFYRVTIANAASVKTLSIIDGKLEVSEDLINGSLTRN